MVNKYGGGPQTSAPGLELPTGSLGCIGLEDILWKGGAFWRLEHRYSLEEVAQEGYCGLKPRVLEVEDG